MIIANIFIVELRVHSKKFQRNLRIHSKVTIKFQRSFEFIRRLPQVSSFEFIRRLPLKPIQMQQLYVFKEYQ